MEKDHKKGIAIVGMSCRFPGSNNPKEFWNLISKGKNKFTSIPKDRQSKFDFSSLKTKEGSFLENPFDFDHNYFNISDAEALAMDPQQRIMLELALEAKENALIQDFEDRNIGVFIGANQRSYTDGMISKSYRSQFIEKIKELDTFNSISNDLKEKLLDEISVLTDNENFDTTTLTGNISNIIAGRISHVFNLNGPSLTIDTACSSSLVAIHMACESLRNKECNLAYAGGINLNLTPTIFSMMEKTGAISSSGTCIPFSEKSDGILLGEGGALVLLKRLEDAIRDGDMIHSVIKGSGVNNDGRSLGIMAPSWKGQLDLLESVYTKYDFDRNKIGYMEAHGTSTRIGDAIEMTVIEKFFEQKNTPLHIGSVKSNIGHTMAASGIASLIKVIMAIRSKQIPPTLFGQNINPKWKLRENKFFVNDVLKEWESNNLRSAGVSSFGFGGTNAHLIVEEPDTTIADPKNRKPNYTKLNRKKFEFELYPPKEIHKESIFSIEWIKIELEESSSNYKPDVWLLFCDESKLKLYEQIQKFGMPCISILPGKKYTRTDDLAYTIDYTNEKHLKWIQEELRGNQSIGIVYSPLDNKNENPQKTFEEILFIKRLINAAVRSKTEYKLWCICSNSQKVNDQEIISPHEHAISTLFSSALNENPQLRGGVINLKTNIRDDISLLPKLLTSQFTSPLVIRNGDSFTPKLIQAKKNKEKRKKYKLRNKGVYLIIGGSSGIGEEIVKHIHGKCKAKIIVSGTRPGNELPESLKSIMGGSIEYIQSSITDRDKTCALLNSIFKKYKKLNGVFVCAGTNKIGAFKAISDIDLEKVISTKLKGIRNLHGAIKNQKVDFVYILSSASSLTPYWSYNIAAYGAANAYVNAIALSNNSKNTKWLSRSWTIWENIGMSKNINTTLFKSMLGFKKSQAIRALDYSLKFKEPHLAIIHPDDSKAFTHQWSTKTQPTKKKKSKSESLQLKLPQSQKNGIDEIQSSNEIKPYIKSLIANETAVDINAINENEAFNNLGLDSISALDIVSKIETAYELSLNPTLLFEFDTVAKLSEHLEQLNGSQSNSTKLIGILPKDLPSNGLVNGVYKLLATQKTFYSNQQFYPDLPCNCMVKVSFDRAFDYKILSQAWDLVIDQNQAMKLVFKMTKDGPCQSLSVSNTNKIKHHDIKNENRSIESITEIENRMINKVYQFDGSPLYDLCYIENDESRSTIILNAHHIITDAWSINLLLSELMKMYSKIESGGFGITSVSNNSFLEYAHYKNNETITDKTALSSKFWANELKGFIPFDLPVKNVLNCVASMKNGSYHTILSAKILKQIDIKAKSENITLFQKLLASYFLTIKHFSDQRDIVINLANDNRDRSFPKINKIAGCIADSKPLRIKISSNDSLVSIGEKVKTKLIEVGKFNSLSSIDHTSLQNLRSELGPKGITPFGMSYLNIDYFNNDSILADATIEARSALPFTDLSLICLKQKGQLHISWNYSATSFTKEYIEVINEVFLGYLNDQSSMTHPAKNSGYSEVELPTTTLFPNNSLLHEKVFAACDIYKNSIAICDNENTISYAELKTKSIQLANVLVESKSNQGEAIGILEYPGVNASIGILGILASNCAYIPLDPDWPHQRIETIIAHSGIDVLVTSSLHFKSIIENEKILKSLKAVVFLDDLTTDALEYKGLKFLNLSNSSKTTLPLSLKHQSPNSMAYVMYTSGTTGKPKGVAVRHSAIAIFLSWISEEFKISADDKFIATSSLGFGGSLRQMFSTLLAGGEIHPIDRFDFKDPKSLLEYLVDHEITIFNTVPSVLQNICSYIELTTVNKPRPDLSKLRLILVGGEILHAKTVNKWRNFFGSSHLIYNLYGSTETIVNATFQKVNSEQPVPIGKTRKGSHVLLMNEHGRLCENDEKGEMLVGGPSLACGYYKDKTITQQKFVNLNVKGAHGIYYRTGDLATKDSKGVYHYLGRNDNQIQLHGNRIEPSEIESVLVNQKGISNAAIVGCKTDSAHFLIAYIECSKEHRDVYTDIDIREIIGKKLPRYMIPQKIEFVDHIPLNHAGKIDRAQLNSIAKSEEDRLDENNDEKNSAEQVSQQTQEIIKKIWQENLKISDIELDSDFFMIGGDSISVLQVLHDLRKEFRIVPKPVELFRLRTINQLSNRIDLLNTNIEAPFNSPILKKKENSIDDTVAKLPLSLSQKGFLYLHKIDPSSSPNLVALFPVKGNLEMDKFEDALNYLISRHPILRTYFLTDQSNTTQSVVPDLNAKIELIDISNKAEQKQKESINKVFEEFKLLKFNLQKPPLFEMQVLKRSKSSFILVAAMHHIIGDAWSFKVLMNELLKAYDLKLIDPNAQLAELNSTFFDFALKESKAIAPGRDHELDIFWRNNFHDLAQVELPSKNLTSDDNSQPLTIKITTHQSVRLKEFCSKNGISLFQLILTCYARALFRILKVNSVLINSALSGRDVQIKDVNKIIGCFARNIPVRIDISNDELIIDAKKIENAFLDSFEHKDIHPSKLIKILLDSGGRIESLSRFIISFMDFSAMADYSSSNIEFDLGGADLYFDAGSASSELMLSIRVTDEVILNLSGKANLQTKNLVITSIQNELIGLTNEPQSPLRAVSTETTYQINSALIAYLPSSDNLAELLPSANNNQNIGKAFIDRIMPDGKPKLLEIEKTTYGQAGIVFLPLPADDLFKLKNDDLIDLIMEAVKVAAQHGAKNISLAGNLASKTNYGFSVSRKLPEEKLKNSELTITTGHSCTVVSVIKTIEKLILELELKLTDLTVGIAGYGSIGQASLDLLIEKLGAPKKIIIADLAHQLPYLNKKIENLKSRFKNTIEIIGVIGSLPNEFYSANLIIGASSSGQILDVDKFLPGTILADDSFPHIVDTKKAIARMKNARDILTVGAGKIDLGKSDREFVNWPFSKGMISEILNKLGNEGLPGCLAEAILLSHDKNLKNTLGLVTTSNALSYWNRINELNIKAVNFHLQGFDISDSLIKNLKNIYSKWES